MLELTPRKFALIMVLLVLAMVALGTACSRQPAHRDAGMTRTAGWMNAGEVWTSSTVVSGGVTYDRRVRGHEVRYFTTDGLRSIAVPAEVPIP